MPKNLFNSVKMTRPGKNMFDLTHDVKLSANAGKLIPILVMEAVPGDSFKIGCDMLIRMAPMVSPMMHRSDATVHYFFVPNRLLWPKWVDWISNNRDEITGLLPAHPYIQVSQVWRGDDSELPDYMGIPMPPEPDSISEKISALPFAAFQMIFNEFYRDENLIDPVDYELTDGDNTLNTDLKTTRYRAWEHDYFTSALPFAQKGESVDIPLGTVELKEDWNSLESLTENGWPKFRGVADDLPPTGQVDSAATLGGQIIIDSAAAGFDPAGSLEVQPTTLNDLRTAMRLQEWLEKNARGGTRYPELILAHFAVRSPDYRLQRPEYITGVKAPLVISEVLNTTGTEELPQGNMAGRGVGVVNGAYGRYFAQEHGYIIGIMSILPKTAYMQGIEKHYLKYDDPTQLYWPSFANLGEQEIQIRELFAFTALGGNTFGYIPRYAEYKFMNNRVAGQFRSSLSTWTWPRKFLTEPALNQTFIECKPDYDPFAVIDPAEDHFYCQILNKISAVRPMPKYGTPTF